MWFDFFSLGERGELRLSQKLYKHNIIKYKNIGEHLDRLLELDILLDKNHSEVKQLLKNLINNE